MVKKLIIIILLLGVLIGGFIGFITYFAKGSFETGANLSKNKGLKSDGGRTNILIVGVDTRDEENYQSGTLTDTMIVASVDFTTKNVKLLSLPRDLWSDTYKMKINSIYALKDFDALKSTIEQTLEIKIHYTAQVNFSAFEKIIDTVGGIDVNNPIAFTDYNYPKFGYENETCGIDLEKLKKEKEKNDESVVDEDFRCRYETLIFKQGIVSMNGALALKYARSRHSIDGGQGSDFARAKRQHLVIEAIKDKILNSSTLANPAKLKDLYFLIQEMVKTDLTSDEFLLLLPKATSFSEFKTSSAVISDTEKFEDGGVVTRGNPDFYGGAYVLVPKTPDSIKSFVTSYFYATLNATPTPSNE